MKICVVDCSDNSKFKFFNSIEDLIVFLYELDLCLDADGMIFNTEESSVMLRSLSLTDSPEIYRHYIYIDRFLSSGSQF